MSATGPTWRSEASAASVTRKAARYIEERKSSLTVSVSLMVQTIESPFTVTSAARSATIRIPACGRSS